MLDIFRPEVSNLGPMLDLINQKLVRDAVSIEVGGLITPQSWGMKRAMLSKRATT